MTNLPPVFGFVLSLSLLFILSGFFDLVCEDVGAGTWKTGREGSGAIVFGFSWLTWGGRFVLILHDLVKRVPEVCDCFVFGGHGEYFFDLTV